MAGSLPLSGRIPFQVVLDPTPGNLTRFTRALLKSRGIVAGGVIGKLLWTVWVWLEYTQISNFEKFCQPYKFDLIPSDQISSRGTPKPVR